MSVLGKRQIAPRAGDRPSKLPVDCAETLKPYRRGNLCRSRLASHLRDALAFAQRFHRLGARQPGAADQLITGRMIGAVLRCLIWTEARVGAHYLNRTLEALGHDASLMSPNTSAALLEGQKNDFPGAETIAEAVQHLK